MNTLYPIPYGITYTYCFYEIVEFYQRTFYSFYSCFKLLRRCDMRQSGPFFAYSRQIWEPLHFC